jgi:Domain of unknown function (DUF4253)
MADAELPAEGELRLGQVSLPTGKIFHAGDFGAQVPVAWVTLEDVPDAGRAWALLSQARPATGLVPFLLDHLSNEPTRPWDTEEFWDDAVGVSEIDRMHADGQLERLWHIKTHDSRGNPSDDPYLDAEIAPFTRQFPELAPAMDAELTGEQVADILDSLGPRRLGLVPAQRPADVPPLIGWQAGNRYFRDAAPVAAVLRSWEDRFGATLLAIGFDEIRLLAARPPRTIGQAERIAAEHWAFCDECGGRGLSEIREIADHLLKSPIWTFWWD